jgi:hypothetical protein
MQVVMELQNSSTFTTGGGGGGAGAVGSNAVTDTAGAGGMEQM